MGITSRVRTIIVLACALVGVAAALTLGGRLQSQANADRDAEQALTELRLQLPRSLPRADDPRLVGESARLRAALREPRSASPAEIDALLREAAAEHRTASAAALRHARGQWVALIFVLFGAFAWFYARIAKARRVAERLAERNRDLLAVSRQEALTDALTGLGNRRALMAALGAARPERDGARLVLALFDLNGFKQYNDRHGHPAGDALLTRLGARLAATMHGIGTAYRIGGDEFCFLARVAEGGEGALAALAAGALSEPGIECAAGVAVMPDDTCAPNVALSLADQRMYANKATFRAGFAASDEIRQAEIGHVDDDRARDPVV